MIWRRGRTDHRAASSTVRQQEQPLAPPQSSSSRRVAAALLVAALFAAGCSSGGSSTTELATETDAVESGDTSGAESTVEQRTEPVETTAPIVLPTSTPPPTPIALAEMIPEFGPTGRPTAAGEVNVLTATAAVSRPVVYDEPDGEVVQVSYEYLNGTVDPTYDWLINPTYFGNPLALLVLDGEPGDDWAQVEIPTRPTMQGWIETADYTWSTSNHYVRIDISTNTVTVWDGDEVIVDEVSVVTGDSGRETPVATTYVDEIMRGPSSAYGPWLLSLGVFSEAINTFGSAGGLPKVAMHGTNRPDLLGQYASNGCIRLPNDVITMLAEKVPVGTRVDIVRSA